MRRPAPQPCLFAAEGFAADGAFRGDLNRSGTTAAERAAIVRPCTPEQHHRRAVLAAELRVLDAAAASLRPPPALSPTVDARDRLLQQTMLDAARRNVLARIRYRRNELIAGMLALRPARPGNRRC